MPHSILITSASFLETPGPHLELLNESGALVTRISGPLNESQLIEIAEKLKVEGIICGTDQFTASVLEKFSPSLKVISRYGVGIDQIDSAAAEGLGVKVLSTPRLNHASVAELTIGLMVGMARKIPQQISIVKNGEWRRETGFDLAGKTVALLGFGMVGRQVARHAMALGMRVSVYNSSWSEAQEGELRRLETVFSDRQFWGESVSIERVIDDGELLGNADFVSMHMDLNRQNTNFINDRRLDMCKQGVFLVNVSRPGLVDEGAVLRALERGRLAGFAADVIESTTVRPGSPLLMMPNVHVVPHIGGRTFDGVVKQGLAAVNNLLSVLTLDS